MPVLLLRDIDWYRSRNINVNDVENTFYSSSGFPDVETYTNDLEAQLHYTDEEITRLRNLVDELYERLDRHEAQTQTATQTPQENEYRPF